MDLSQFIYLALPILAALLGYLMNRLVFSRLDTLERKMADTVTKTELKEYVTDKIHEIKTDLVEVKDKLDRINDYIIYGQNDRHGKRDA